MKKDPVLVSIETSTVVRVLALVTLFVAGIWVVVHVSRELVWIGTAFFLAVALDPAVTWIAKILRSGRLLAATVIFVAFVGVIGFLGASLVPPLISQTESLISQTPRYLQQAEDSNTYVGHFVQKYHLVDRAKEAQSHAFDTVTAGGTTALGIVKGIFASAAAIVTILVLAFFMLLEGPSWVALGWRYVPDDEQTGFHRILAKMYDIVAGYMTGNIIIAIISSVVAAIAIGLLGVPYAIPFGILFGVSTLVPIVGGVVAAGIICIVALFTSITAAVILLVFFTVYQFLDGHVLRPLIFGRTIEMSPLLVIVSIVLGTALAGMVGALLAIPVVACLGVVLAEVTGNAAAAPRHTARKKIAT